MEKNKKAKWKSREEHNDYIKAKWKFCPKCGAEMTV